MSQGPLAVAAAQTVPVRGDVDTNLARHADLARVATDAGARVVVFPELSLTGYELGLAAGLAFAEDDPRLAPLAGLARATGATLVVGAPVRLDGRLHIGAFVLRPDGAALVYTKQRLGSFPAEVNPGGAVPPAEPTVFAPGDRDPLVPLGGDHVAALAICADTGRPEHAAGAAARGATTYLAGMFFPASERAREHDRLRARAARHALCVVAANFGGPTGGLPSGGRSAIWAPGGELLVALDDEGPGVAVALERPDGWRTVKRAGIG